MIPFAFIPSDDAACKAGRHSSCSLLLQIMCTVLAICALIVNRDIYVGHILDLGFHLVNVISKTPSTAKCCRYHGVTKRAKESHGCPCVKWILSRFVWLRFIAALISCSEREVYVHLLNTKYPKLISVTKTVPPSYITSTLLAEKKEKNRNMCWAPSKEIERENIEQREDALRPDHDLHKRHLIFMKPHHASSAALPIGSFLCDTATSLRQILKAVTFPSSTFASSRGRCQGFSSFRMSSPTFFAIFTLSLFTCLESLLSLEAETLYFIVRSLTLCMGWYESNSPQSTPLQ